jgi:hypothetical protein
MIRRVTPLTAAACFAASLVPAAIHAAPPAVANLSPRGLQVGQPTTLVVTGSDLGADAKVVLPVKIAAQAIKGDAKPDRVEIEVTLDPGVQPGIYPLRVAGAGGISSPVLIGIDKLRQVAFAPTVTELPVAMHGAVGGAQVLQIKLTCKKDQRLVLDVEAQRLGAGLKPIVRLYDPRGTQIAWSPPRTAIGGDARVDAVLPADAEYTIELHDQLYRPAGPGFFRLKIGDLHYADFAVPLGVSVGSKQAIKFASTNLVAPVETDATAQKVPGETVAWLQDYAAYTGAAPRLALSEFAELTEAPAAADGKLQELPLAPTAISGVLSAAGEEDKFLIGVTPGQKLRFDIVARQFGSPVDGVLSVRNEQGSQLAAGEDRPGSSDPLVDFTVPDGVNKLQIAFKDLQGRGGSDFVYRIAVLDLGRPDFGLSLATDRIIVPAGGTQVVPIQVARTSYNGPIELTLEGLPPEIQLQGNIVPPGATIGLLTLSAQSVSPQAVLTRLVGRALEAQPPVARAATFGEFAGSRYQPRVRAELGLAIATASPISIVWVPQETDKLFLGGKLPAKVQLTRAEGTPGSVRVRLLTTQPTPKKTIKENNQDKVVDDLDRALRLEGDPVFAADQKEVTVNVLVPGDLPQQNWDLVLVADLLTADGKNVVTSNAAPVRTLAPVAPFTLTLTSPPAAEGKAGAGETGRLTGKIDRAAGSSQAVIVTLDGLPKGYFSPQVLVPADKADFELPLTFAFGSKPGELKGKLVALSAPATATSIRSNAIDVTVNVVPGEKPAAEPPKEIFEDSEEFAKLLTEGAGQALVFSRDKYSGAACLRVTPDQKFNPMLPGLGVKIRENPGPGEFRYIRYAWKKTGGNSICLQLNHDGAWGPGGGREGAKFRYHAGPGGECYTASLAISDKLPAKFEVVTRDLFLDFGEFTLTGLAFSPVDGQAAFFDHMYLGRQVEDFDLLKVEKK